MCVCGGVTQAIAISRVEREAVPGAGVPGDSEDSPAASLPVQRARALVAWDRHGRVARLGPKRGP